MKNYFAENPAWAAWVDDWERCKGFADPSEHMREVFNGLLLLTRLGFDLADRANLEECASRIPPEPTLAITYTDEAQDDLGVLMSESGIAGIALYIQLHRAAFPSSHAQHMRWIFPNTEFDVHINPKDWARLFRPYFIDRLNEYADHCAELCFTHDDMLTVVGPEFQYSWRAFLVCCSHKPTCFDAMFPMLGPADAEFHRYDKLCFLSYHLMPWQFHRLLKRIFEARVLKPGPMLVSDHSDRLIEACMNMSPEFVQLLREDHSGLAVLDELERVRRLYTLIRCGFHPSPVHPHIVATVTNHIVPHLRRTFRFYILVFVVRGRMPMAVFYDQLAPLLLMNCPEWIMQLVLEGA